MPPKRKTTKSKSESGGDAGKKKRKQPKKSESSDEFDDLLDDEDEEGNGKHDGNGNAAGNVTHASDLQSLEDNDDDNENAHLYPTLPAETGILLVSGGTNWDLIGRKEVPKAAAKGGNQSQGRNLWGPHRTKYRVNAMISSCSACHSIIITDDGKVMTWGRLVLVTINQTLDLIILFQLNIVGMIEVN